jgi:hypothetical protein
MTSPLDALARRAEHESFFLAAVLAAYARAERLDDAALAGALGCAMEQLVPLRLCRAPRCDAGGFREDVERIASGLQLDAERLAEVVRRGRVAARFEGPAASECGWLMAARDREEGPAPME